MSDQYIEPPLELLRQMNDKELDEVWDSRPLITWGPPLAGMSFDEQKAYWKQHLHITSWSVAKSLVDRVEARLQSGKKLYELPLQSSSESFWEALDASVRHIERQVQGNAIGWLLSVREGPSLHHFGFRLGNQLFLGRVTSAEPGFASPADPEALLTLCDQANAHPVLMPMSRTTDGWATVQRGWGLEHAATGELVDPFHLVTDHKLEMSDFELQDFAVSYVASKLWEQGVRSVSVQASPTVDPSIWFEQDGNPAWVVVRASRYPTLSPNRPGNLKLVEDKIGAESGGSGFFAGVGVANADDAFDPERIPPLPLYRGHGLLPRFTGLEPVRLN